MEDVIKDFMRQNQAAFEKKLIEACAKKGLFLNQATAPDFHVLQVESSTIVELVHGPTGKSICRYTTEPEITTTGNTMTATYIFHEL